MTKAIYVKTSDTCNLHCDHCFTNGNNGGKVKWDVDATQAWIDDYMAQFPTGTRYNLILHGGEPFLAPMDDLERFVENYQADPNAVFSITTNLVLKLDERKLAFLKRLGSVGTSWDLNTRFANDKQKQLWVRNVRTLQNEGIETCVFVSISRAVVEYDIDAFLDEMAAVAPTRIRLERLTLDGNATRNPAIFPDNEAQDLWFTALYKRYMQRRENLPFRIVTLDLIERKLDTQVVKTDTNCRNCEQNLVTMNADGTLGGCPNTAANDPHAHRDDGVEAFMGSEGRLREITHELDFHPNCLQCDVFQLCGGDCHQLPWQGDRCGGLKHLLRYVRDQQQNTSSIIPTVSL